MIDNIITNNVLGLLAGLTYAVSISIVIYITFKRSKFALILLSAEYFYIFGYAISPIIISFNLVGQDDFYRYYSLANGPIENLTFFHLISYSIGMLFGILVYKKLTPLSITEIHQKNVKLGYSQISLYRGLILLGILFLLVYVALVGPVLAFTTAGKVRAGLRDGLEESSAFLFLKNIAQIGTLSVIFLPFIFAQRKKLYDILLLSVYGILLYLLTGARAAITDTIFFCLLVYLTKKKLRNFDYVMLCLFIAFGATFTLYGKGLGDGLSALFFGEESYLEVREGTLTSFIGQFSNLIYSVDAGVKNFVENGFYISKAIVLSPLGILPGWLYSLLGLKFLSWQHVDLIDNIVCLNTISYPLANPCTVPPYIVGFSAYMTPILGGFLIGFLKFYCISSISALWHRAINHPTYLWVPLILFIILVKFTLFIPNVIGLFSFFAILAVIFIGGKKFLLSLAKSY